MAKAKSKDTNPVGRPPIEIEKEEFEKLCGLHCTLIEMAGWFDCSEDTIERWCEKTYGVNFADVFKKKSGKGKVSLRRKQFEAALKGNVTMLIWLGKQQLNQKDQQTVDLDVKPIVFSYSPEEDENNG